MHSLVMKELSTCSLGLRPVAGQGGPGVRTPPEIFQMIFLNRVIPLTFFREGGYPPLSSKILNPLVFPLHKNQRI